MAERGGRQVGQRVGSAPNARDVRGEIRDIQQQVERGETAPLPADVGPFRPTGQPDGRRWLVVLAVAIVGFAAFAIGSQHGVRTGTSFLGGLALSIAAFEFGAFNIRAVDRVAPQFTLAAALFSYLLTAVLFALILAASSPRVIDGPGVAVGLATGLTVWLGALVLASRVRLEQP